MKIKLLYILLYSSFLFGQKPVELKININSIVDIDSLSLRKYTINYSISNLTNNKISFFLNPDSVAAGSAGSMRTDVSATLFQENEELPMPTILQSVTKKDEFTIFIKNLKDGEEKDSIIKNHFKVVLNFDYDKEMKNIEKDSNYLEKKISEKIMKSLMSLEPHETKQYSKVFYWDKKRYYKNNEMEYYIAEKSNCFLQLYIVLLKEELEGILIKPNYTEVTSTANFIKGWYNSNKKEINFKE